MKKRALLIIGLALLIATAGIVYAHWTETLTKSVSVETGDLNVKWLDAWTDDDGVVDGGDVGDTEECAEFDFFPADSSCDPRAAYVNPEPARETKDVARCIVSTTFPEAGIDQDTFAVAISSAYPGYYCNVWASIASLGVVPVKISDVVVRVTDATGAIIADPTAIGIYIDVDSSLCGTQIDPGDPLLAYLLQTVHFTNPLPEDPTPIDTTANYTITESFNFINWNEYVDPTTCVTIASS